MKLKVREPVLLPVPFVVVVVPVATKLSLLLPPQPEIMSANPIRKPSSPIECP